MSDQRKHLRDRDDAASDAAAAAACRRVRSRVDLSPSPLAYISRLYHELLIVFSFLSLLDLSRAIAVCRRWSQLIGSPDNSASMQHVHLCLRDSRHRGAISRSPLRYRVVSLTLEKVACTERLAPLFPNLTALDYQGFNTGALRHLRLSSGMNERDWAPSESLLWPQRLQTLQLSCTGNAVGNQALVDVVCCLPTLTRLDLDVFHTEVYRFPPDSYFTLTPLQTLPLLRSLTSINVDRVMDVHAGFVRFLVCEALVAALALLPSLTVLHLSFECRDASFLSHLVQLTDLRFIDASPDGLAVEHLAPLLQRLDQLTSLDLGSSQFVSRDLALLLPSFPLLHSLAVVLRVDPTTAELEEWARLRPAPAAAAHVLPCLGEFRLRIGHEDGRDAFAGPLTVAPSNPDSPSSLSSTAVDPHGSAGSAGDSDVVVRRKTN